jgi:hypothetical protein
VIEAELPGHTTHLNNIYAFSPACSLNAGNQTFCFKPLAMTDASLTLSPLPALVHRGLSAIATIALLSLVSTAGLFSYLVYHVVARDRRRIVHINQYVALLINLLFADFLQAIGFSLSLRWLQLDGVLVSYAGYTV